MRRVARFIGAMTIAAKLAASLGCAYLAPNAPASMPHHMRALYEEMRGEGTDASEGYATLAEVGLARERFSLEIIVNNDTWKAYVHRMEDGITLVESEDGLKGWRRTREPLEESAMQALYEDHLRRTAEAVNSGAIRYPRKKGTRVLFLGFEGELPF